MTTLAAPNPCAIFPEQPIDVVRPQTAPMSRMTWRDFAWYRMDFQKNLMVINSILLFEGSVDIERLISTIEHRLPNYPRFTQKVGTRFGLPYWVEDQDFDIRKHIELESFDHVSIRALTERTWKMLPPSQTILPAKNYKITWPPSHVFRWTPAAPVAHARD